MKFAALLTTLMPLVMSDDPEGWIREVSFELEKINLIYPTQSSTMFDSTKNPDPFYASNPITNNEESSFDIAANAEDDWMTIINSPCSSTN